MAEISLIIPVYNAEKCIKRCLDSVLSQTYKNFDIICINDGSNDRSGEILDKYARLDKRIIVIHQNNKGIGATRNIGIDYARNKCKCSWIMFVDSDDWVHSSIIELLYTGVKNLNTNICCCMYEKQMHFSEVKLFEIEGDAKRISTKDYFINYNTNATIPTCKLYHIKLFEHVRYPINKIHEDEFTTYKILFQCSEIAIVHLPLYVYISNEEGITKSKWTPKRMDGVDAYEEQFEYFTKKKYMDVLDNQIRVSLFVMRMQLAEIQRLNSDERSEYKKYEIMLRKRMRKVIKKYWKRNVIHVKRDAWILEGPFPLFMQVYWKINSRAKK